MGLQDVAHDAPRRARKTCGDPLLEGMQARTDRRVAVSSTRRDPIDQNAHRVADVERARSELNAARAGDECYIEAIVDDEPCAGSRLFFGERERELHECARIAVRHSRGPKLQRPALAQSAHHRSRAIHKMATADDFVVRDGVQNRNGSGCGVGIHACGYETAAGAVSKRSPTDAPRPCAHSLGDKRRLPAGCTTVMRAAPSPHATVSPFSSID